MPLSQDFQTASKPISWNDVDKYYTEPPDKLVHAWLKLKNRMTIIYSNDKDFVSVISPNAIRVAKDIYIENPNTYYRIKGWIYRLFHRGK
jgi:hypothetical protein